MLFDNEHLKMPKHHSNLYLFMNKMHMQSWIPTCQRINQVEPMLNSSFSLWCIPLALSPSTVIFMYTTKTIKYVNA